MSDHLKSCPECGAVFVKPRSLPDHRRLFGLLRAALAHWPESADFQPASEEQLRAYLLVKAGHYDVEFIAYPEECQSETIKNLFRLAVEATHAACYRKRGYAATRVSAGGIEILTPKSIDFRSLGQREFAPIREAVEQIIENTIGVDATQLLRERAA